MKAEIIESSVHQVFIERYHITNGDKVPCVNKKKGVSNKKYSNP